MQRSKPPLAVWTATALHLGVMVIFTLLYPAYWGFDETGHVSRVLAVAERRPRADAWRRGVRRRRQRHATRCYNGAGPAAVHHLRPATARRPAVASTALGGGTSRSRSRRQLPNQLAQHPPGYYAFAAGVLDAIPGCANLAWDQTVGAAAPARRPLLVAAAVSVLGDRAALSPAAASPSRPRSRRSCCRRLSASAVRSTTTIC